MRKKIFTPLSAGSFATDSKTVSFPQRTGYSPLTPCAKLFVSTTAPPDENFTKVELEPVLKELPNYAVQHGIIEDSIVCRDLFDTKLMSCIAPCPFEVINKFRQIYSTKSPEAATDHCL